MIHEIISFAAANPLVIIILVYVIQFLSIAYLWIKEKRIGATIDLGILFTRLFLNSMGVCI